MSRQKHDLSNINESERSYKRFILLPLVLALAGIGGILLYWTLADDGQINDTEVWEQVLGEARKNTVQQIEIRDPFEGWDTYYFQEISLRYPPEQVTFSESATVPTQCLNAVDIAAFSIDTVSTPEARNSYEFVLCYYQNPKKETLVNFVLSRDNWLNDSYSELKTDLVKNWNTANINTTFEGFVFEGTLLNTQKYKRLLFFKNRSDAGIYIFSLTPASNTSKNFDEDTRKLYDKIVTSIRDKDDRVILK